MEELKKLLEAQNKAFEDFKAANDERLKMLEKGKTDPALEAKVEKANAAVTDLTKQVTELAAKANRPGATTGTTEEQERAAYRGEFETFIRNGVRGERLRNATAGTAATGATAGDAIPQDFDKVIGQIVRNANPMRGVCNVVRSANENYVKLYNQGGADAGWVGETDPRAQTNIPNLAKLVPVYGEVYANIFATQKLLDDASFDIGAWIGSEVGLTFAKEENQKFTDGDGTKAPKGLLAYAMAATADSARAFGTIEKLVSAASGDFSDTELIDLLHKLKAGYRSNAQWMMPTATVAKVRKFKDAASGQYLWQPGLAQGQPAQLLGFPIVENEAMPAIAANKPVIMFADFRAAYTIADVGTYVTLRDPYTQTPYVRFYFARRVGGFLADSNAVKVLVTKV